MVAMEYAEWRKFYREIVEEFSFSEEEDSRGGRVLARLLREGQRTAKEELERLIRGRRVNVFAGGPSLERLVGFPVGLKVACDGATSFFVDRGRYPKVIVTDLDGRVEDQIEASRHGSIAVVHAHGDNIQMLKKYIPSFANVIPTMQAEPEQGVYNFGGFTDGDRAVALACHFKAREVFLYGYDFGGEIGRYSFSRDVEKKKKKLLWSERIIGYLRKNCSVT